MKSKTKFKWLAIAVEDHRLLAEIVKAEDRTFCAVAGRLIRAAHAEQFSKKRKGKT